MTAVNNLLDKYRETCSIASDNALGETLGVKRQAVHQWRKGLSWPSDEHVVEMATKINEAPGAWLAAVHADRTSDKTAKRVWLQAAQSLGYAAGVILTLGIATHSAAAHADALNFAKSADSVYYVKNSIRHPAASLGTPSLGELFSIKRTERT